MNLQENINVRSCTRMLLDSMINSTLVRVIVKNVEYRGVCNMIEREDGSGKHFNLVIGSKKFYATLSDGSMMIETMSAPVDSKYVSKSVFSIPTYSR